VTAPEEEGTYEAAIEIYHDYKLNPTEILILTIKVFQEHASVLVEDDLNNEL